MVIKKKQKKKKTKKTANRTDESVKQGSVLANGQLVKPFYWRNV